MPDQSGSGSRSWSGWSDYDRELTGPGVDLDGGAVAQGRRLGRSSRYNSQPNKAIETGSATNTTSPATSTLTTPTPR